MHKNSNNNKKPSETDIVFVVETCQNCKSHTWNTRHDENKYLDYFNKGKFALPCSPESHHRTYSSRTYPAQHYPQSLFAL